MTELELAELVAELGDGRRHPDRVVYAADGKATNPWRARVRFGVHAEICFVRRDGWTLAAPLCYAGVAWRLWSDQWVAVVPLPCHAGQRMSHN